MNLKIYLINYSFFLFLSILVIEGFSIWIKLTLSLDPLLYFFIYESAFPKGVEVFKFFFAPSILYLRARVAD